MPLKRYLILRDSMEELTHSLDCVCLGVETKTRVHLGSNMFATVQSPYRCVNINQWDKVSKTVKRRSFGICLNAQMWQNFLKEDAKVDSLIPDLKTTVICQNRDDHQQIWGATLCSECHPDTFNAGCPT
jgi:hypothetical protein